MITDIGMPGSALRLVAMFEFDKQPATRHVRVILIQKYDGEYVVSTQYGDRDPTAVDQLKAAVDDERIEVKWDRSWAQGHYFSDIDEARKYFLERCTEGR